MEMTEMADMAAHMVDDSSEKVAVASWMQGVPQGWYERGVLTQEEAQALLAPCATVAQKCTGRAKKPVFLFPQKVVKGPWHLPQERERLGRELGCGALMKHWAMPAHPKPVLQGSLFAHPENQRVYLVTSALYPMPTEERPWQVESESSSASAVGPRRLRVIARASLGVVRVSDRLREDPGYLLGALEVWEHLIHRCLLQCGDSGFHNMLVDPLSGQAVGIDLDEQRRASACETDDWVALLFKSPPARALHPWMMRSVEGLRQELEVLFVRLEEVCQDAQTASIVEQYGLYHGDWDRRIAQLRRACRVYLRDII